jgi:IS4 transposase
VVYEQDVEIADATGGRSRLRRVSVKLTAPTRNGDTTLVVLTDLPREVADAVAVVELYRTRWRIETAFQRRSFPSPPSPSSSPMGRARMTASAMPPNAC